MTAEHEPCTVHLILEDNDLCDKQINKVPICPNKVPNLNLRITYPLRDDISQRQMTPPVALNEKGFVE